MFTCGRATWQNADVGWEYFISRLLFFNLQRLLIILEFHDLLYRLFSVETNFRSREGWNLRCKISISGLSPFNIEGGLAITLFDICFLHPKILACFVCICYFDLNSGYSGSGTKEAHPDDFNAFLFFNILRFSAWLITIILYVFFF